MAEWSALLTGKRGDPSSNPAEVKTFFELNFNLNKMKFFLINKNLIKIEIEIFFARGPPLILLIIKLLNRRP